MIISIISKATTEIVSLDKPLKATIQTTEESFESFQELNNDVCQSIQKLGLVTKSLTTGAGYAVWLELVNLGINMIKAFTDHLREVQAS